MHEAYCVEDGKDISISCTPKHGPPSISSSQGSLWTLEKQLSNVQRNRSWPSDPSTVRRRPPTAIVDLCLDIILFGLSGLFFIFGLLVWHYDYAAVAAHGDMALSLKDATRYGPTIFPIVFAAILGRASRYCLTWRLERGESLGVLDLLASSTTVSSIVLSQLALRRLSLLGCCLAALWLLSPLGSQAALRVMTVDSLTSSNTTIVHYLSLNSLYVQWGWYSSGTLASITSGIYSSSILSPTKIKHSPRDLWNNVKIPMIESLSNNTSNDWLIVPANGVTYSALVGVPVYGLSTDASMSFTMETSYWYLDCPILTEGEPIPGIPDDISKPASPLNNRYGVNSNGWRGGKAFSSTLISNSSSDFPWLDTSSHRVPASGDLKPRTFIYNSFAESQIGAVPKKSYTGSFCRMSTSYVEVEIDCSGAICTASRIRKSRSAHPPEAYTLLDSLNSTYWQYFSREFVKILDAGDPGRGTLVQGYLSNPDMVGTVGTEFYTTEFKPTRTWTLDRRIYADRLGQLLNTFWLASIGPGAVLNGLSPTNSKMNSTAAVRDDEQTSKTAVAQVLDETKSIHCHGAWLAALLFTSGILMIASLVPPYVRFYLGGTELFLNISTMTRDNPNVAVPTRGTFLQNSKRSRLLKDVKVRYGDLQPERDIGRLGIGSIDDDCAVAVIRKDRLYE